jgi:hypothetical protein
MLVAKIVVETQPGKATLVATHLGQIKGMAAPSADGDHRVTATWKVPDGDTVEGLCEVLQALNPEILQVYPALVEEDED